MKKFLKVLICALFAAVCAMGFAACGGEKQAISVYAPDGAPALALTSLISEDNEKLFGRELNYNVVEASSISAYVTGEQPKADICVLPVNAASLLLGTGENYKLLGTVTHGNLFLLKKANGEDITLENLSTLVGKTVGVINLAAIPGLTFKLILNDNDIAYNELGNDGNKAEDKVNLLALNATQVLPNATDCDYFVVPEPAASTKVNATQGKLSFAGSLQNLYGGENGYPQAVIVAKNSLIESSPKFIKEFTDYLGKAENGVLEKMQGGQLTAEGVLSVITQHLTDGLSPTFTAANLTENVVKNCAIKFVKSTECKSEIDGFLDKLIAVSANSAKRVSEEFYYSY